MANLYTFPNATLSGGDQLLTGITAQLPAFPVFILLIVYFVVTLGGALAQATRRGYIDFPMWSLLGFLTIDLLAVLMTMAEGLMNPIVLGVCFGLTILNALWFFMTMGRFEQV